MCIMAYKDARRGEQYRNDYTRQTYDRMSVLAPKADGERIRAAAANAGQSVSAYILQAINERMERDNNKSRD